MNFDLNDPLDDLIGSPLRATPAKPVPAAVEKAAFIERCPRCLGSGRYGTLGACFACKGKGSKSFKNSYADRAANRQKAADRKVRAEADRAAEFAKDFPAESEWLAKQKFDFAAKMREVIIKYGYLTDGQMAAVRKCMLRDETRAAEREAAKIDVDVSKIEAAFATARARANRPGQIGVWTRPLPLTSTSGMTVSFQPGTAGSQWEGMVFVKAMDGRKLGHVKAGKFSPRFGCTEAETACVIECAGEPAAAAKAYGKAWSRCCVCSRTLTNDGSIEAGIGPICAEKYGF